MRTARHLYRNTVHLASSVLTASGSATGYDVRNLKSPSRFRRWRSTTTNGDQWVKVDQGGANNWQANLLLDARIHPGGAVRIQANATDDWGAPTIDDLVTIPADNPTGIIGVWRAAVSNLRWVRILFQNTGAVNAFVELAVWGLGTYYQPPYSLEPRYRYALVDPSVIHETPNKNRSATLVAPYFVIEGSYPPILNAVNLATFIDLIRNSGRHTPHFFAINPDDMAFMTFYGRFNQVPAATHVNPLRMRWSFEFQEDK